MPSKGEVYGSNCGQRLGSVIIKKVTLAPPPFYNSTNNKKGTPSIQITTGQLTAVVASLLRGAPSPEQRSNERRHLSISLLTPNFPLSPHPPGAAATAAALAAAKPCLAHTGPESR